MPSAHASVGTNPKKVEPEHLELGKVELVRTRIFGQISNPNPNSYDSNSNFTIYVKLNMGVNL